MSGSDTKLTGPDLATDGIAAGDLGDGGKLLGHAFGDPVLLARIGDSFLAIGATCTHYGGPLAEGMIVGDTVRCPWHHACFSLRTGEATAAPALSPVPCYEVERRDGRVFVARKVERGPLEPSRTSTVHEPAGAAPPRDVVIIGAGAAGTAAAEMLRRSGYGGRITMIDGDPDAPYDRPNLSKDYLAGNAPEEWIPLRPPGFYDEHRIDIVRDTVTGIDVADKRVTLQSGDARSYDALLIATGAEPVALPIDGAHLPHVHYLRSLADSRAIIAATEHAKRAVVIGASFIGLEVAASLRARQLEVDVVAPESLPLRKVLGDDLGEFIKALHEEHGVRFHLSHKPRRIDAGTVTLDDDTRIDADLVVIGVGVRPRLALAQNAGLTMDHGIVVDEYLMTSAPNVYAAGDIARWPDAYSGKRIRVEHWVVAERMGQTAARNMLGARERFDDVPFFWSAHYDTSINYVGHAEQWSRTVVDGSAAQRDVAVRYEDAGRLLALATIFRDDESLRAEVEMERGTTAR
jgi:NADPH-dependent 2,4-dienoyl-CoA reductase/sulfur reductase-like enzyme/nitrite reductase/ring-hydroxylating ferredoxin subunit